MKLIYDTYEKVWTHEEEEGMIIKPKKMIEWLKKRKDEADDAFENAINVNDLATAIEEQSSSRTLEYIIDYVTQGKEYRKAVDDDDWIIE